MAVSIKSEREIELMRQAGKILAKVHEELGQAIRPGISNAPFQANTWRTYILLFSDDISWQASHSISAR